MTRQYFLVVYAVLHSSAWTSASPARPYRKQNGRREALWSRTRRRVQCCLSSFATWRVTPRSDQPSVGARGRPVLCICMHASPALSMRRVSFAVCTPKRVSRRRGARSVYRYVRCTGVVLFVFFFLRTTRSTYFAFFFFFVAAARAGFVLHREMNKEKKLLFCTSAAEMKQHEQGRPKKKR